MNQTLLEIARRVAVLVLSAGLATAGAAQLYVSPEGDDANPGTEARPFATLVRARDAVRVLKKTTREDIVVLLRGGVYPLTDTVVFTMEGSAAPGQRITYAAYPGETPVLSAGASVKN